MTRKKNKNKMLIYLLLGLLAIIVIVIIIFLVNRNNNKSKKTKTESPSQPINPNQGVSSSTGCDSGKYYDYITNQCTDKIAAGGTCKNGVSCNSGVCVLENNGTGTCGGDQLSKNCIEIDTADTNKCKTCYNLTLNDNKQCCPEHCIDCDRDGKCKVGKCASGYYLDNNRCKSGKSYADLKAEKSKLETEKSELEAL